MPARPQPPITPPVANPEALSLRGNRGGLIRKAGVGRRIRAARGLAIVSVVAVLGLMVLLFVAMMDMASGARAGAGHEVVQQRLTALEPLPGQLVVTQLREATGRSGELWISQPGALRRYGSDGRFVAGHRLYSADSLTVVDEAGLLGDQPPTNWRDLPARWVDLNEPVVSDDRAVFPILDPRAAVAIDGHDPVDGFSVDPSFPGVRLGADPLGLRAPMPVRWLYVLADGNFGPGDESGRYLGSGQPGEDNPIIARVAYWTDDETAKLHVNTASEPTAWDTPRAFSAHLTNQGPNQSQVLQDRAYAARQPAQREYQRYPGHPAMNSLAPVLFSGSRRFVSPDDKERIYELVPRIATGGSRGGTSTVSESTGLIPGSERLYANLDEFLFQPDRRPHDLLDHDLLARSRFFLTGNSRAPELNLFGSPRVTVWPTHVDATDSQGRALRTGYDNLIRFCSSIGGARHFYGFQRSDNRSPTADWTGIARNRELLRYLQRLSNQPLPGYGGRLVDNLGARDRDQLLVQMLDYVRSSNLYDDNLQPTRYNTLDHQQVQFTKGRRHNSDTYGWKGHGEVVPLRVPAGLGDSYPPAGQDQTSHMGFGRFYTISEAGILLIACADGNPGNTWSVRSNVASGPDRNLMLDENQPLEEGERRIQMMLVFEWFCASHGWTQIRPDFSIEVEQFGGTFTIDGQPMEIPSLVAIDTDDPAFQCWGLHPWGAGAGYRGFLKNRRVPARGSMPADTRGSREFGLVSAPVTVDATRGYVEFEGPERIEVRIYGGTSYTGNRQLVQTIELHFPAANFPLPELKTTASRHVSTDGQSRETVPENWWSLNRNGPGLGLANGFGRLEYVWGRPFDSQGTIIRPEDTFRSLAPYHGDYRLTAASHHVPAGVFVPTTAYFNTDRATAIRSHITGSSGANQPWQTNYFPPGDQRLVPHANYDGSRRPNFPVLRPRDGGAELPAALFQTTGDFDNGIATTYDGPYINKPDEGNTFQIDSGGEIPYFSRNWNQVPAGEAYFSPNRQLPGPGMFGSLPARLASGNRPLDPDQPEAVAGSPWRTLLFRPQSGHPGAADPPDHLWMDLFWMPVVEPWAVSEPWSTAGKINLNYQILPFTHLRRATALHGLLRSEEMLMVRTNQANQYKGSGALPQVRYPIDPEATLVQFEERFAAGGAFRTATEICEVHLVPAGHPDNPTAAAMESFWQAHAVTGDNSRERPYANLQPRLTVRSNTYRVHYRVQSIQKARSTPADRFVPGEDRVNGDRRGHYLVERYLDPNDPAIPDHATDPSAPAVDGFYHYRIEQPVRFNGR